MSIVADVNPAMLKWARESIGMSRANAAKKAGTSKDRVSSWEAGDASPSIRQARLLAEAFGRPLAVFYLEEPPKNFSVIKRFRTIAEGVGGNLSPDAQLLIAQLRERQEWAKEYLSNEGFEPLDYVGKYSLNDKPAVVAEEMRDFLLDGFTDTFSDSRKRLNMWVTAVESAGVFVTQTSGRGKVTVDDARGFALVDDIAPFVFVNAKDSLAGRLFTLLHEFGHLLLGGSAISVSPLPSARSQVGKIERFCDRFASHALLPEERLKAVLVGFNTSTGVAGQVRDMASQLGVSPLAVATRLRQKGSITEDHYLSVFEYTREALKSKDGAEKTGGNYYVAEPYRIGKKFLALAADAYARRSILGGHLSSLTGVKLNNFDRMMASIKEAS